MPVLRRIAAAVRAHYALSDDIVNIDDFDGDCSFRCQLSSHIASQIFWYGEYSGPSLRLLAKHLQETDVVLDIGANEGEHTVFAAKRVRKGRVVAFEPNPRIRARLVENVTANRFTNVTVMPSALADRAGKAALYAARERTSDHSYNDGLSSLYPRPGLSLEERHISITTLDDFVRGERLPRVDWMKIDVEGSEYSVLNGGRWTLATFRPRIILEVENDAAKAAGQSAAALIALVEEQGYTVFNIGRRGEISASAGSFTRDVLCVPRDASPSLVKG
jgi:FkbM family methyltransferase